MTTLRLVAVDGVRVDRPAHSRSTRPDFTVLSRRARDVLYMLTIGDVEVPADGLFSLPVKKLAEMKGWDQQDAGNALHELQDAHFIELLLPNYGPRPKVWRLHPRWNPAMDSSYPPDILVTP